MPRAEYMEKMIISLPCIVSLYMDAADIYIDSIAVIKEIVVLHSTKLFKYELICRCRVSRFITIILVSFCLQITVGIVAPVFFWVVPIM